MGLPLFALFSKAGRLPLDLALVFILFTLILGTDFVFGEQAAFMRNILYMYLFLFLVGRVMLPKVQKSQLTLNKAIFNFMAMFIATAVIMMVLPKGIGAVLATGSFDAMVVMAASFGALYAFIKAYIEEDVFRNRLVNYIGEKGQAVAFGLFHFFVLLGVVGFSYFMILSIGILIALGYMWGKVQDRFGTIGSTGSHTAYNAGVMGILPRIMGAVV